MSIADELREWATSGDLTPEGWMSERAWDALWSFRGDGFTLCGPSDDDRRTFALLVAEELDHG